MTNPDTSPSKAGTNTETWTMASEGTCWVWVKDPREGGMIKQRVGGRAGGSRTLHISTDDRRFNEEQVIEEMEHHNIFKNGTLAFVSSTNGEKAADVDTKNQITAQDMRALLEIRDEDLFRSEVTDLSSELVVRRLKNLAEKDGTAAQNEVLTEIIEQRWKVGGTQRTVRELMDAGERIGGQVVSETS